MPDPTHLFGGKPGQPVPPVDPDDLKTAFEIFQNVARRYPDGRSDVGVDVFQHPCKPGAGISAITYRAMMLGVVVRHAQAQLAPWTKDGHLDLAVFHEAAQLPMEWMGVGFVRESAPFDADEFLRRLRGEVA